MIQHIACRCPLVFCVCAEGVKAEAAYAKDSTVLPDPESTTNAEFKVCVCLSLCTSSGPFLFVLLLCLKCGSVGVFGFEVCQVPPL